MTEPRKQKGRKAKNATSSTYPCGTCSEEVVDNALMCQSCDVWYHIQCLEIPGTVLNLLQKVSGLIWICASCEGAAKRRVKHSSDQIAEEVSEIKNSVTTLAKTVQAIAEKQKEIDSEPQVSVFTGPELPHRERQEKRNLKAITSLRISNLGEVTADSYSERIVKERESILKIFNHLGENCKDSISDILRLGQFKKDAKRPRAVLVKFTNPWTAHKLLANANLLKGSEYKVFLSRDLTPEEQRIEKMILKKRYELIQEGEVRTNLKIRNLQLYRNGKVVKLTDE